MTRPHNRVSLAEVNEHAGRQLRHATSDSLDEEAPPTLQDLAESLFFSPGDGRIWLNDQRMFLMHTASFGALRRELIETIGADKTRELFTRIGYASGARDAELIRRRWPDADLATTFNAGPRLHALEGIVKVNPVRFELDVDNASFYGEFTWHDSTEAMEHLATYGISSAPTCWMQIGYASGYASIFLGKLVIYREAECRACGGSHCRVIGRPADEWEDAEEDLRYFKVDSAPRPANGRRTAADGAVIGSRSMPGGAGDTIMVGMSSAFRAAHHMLERVAPTSATVLFAGESGVGKELFANTLHAISPRAAKPFVALNCAAIPDTLVEAELFGVERGAYTGANASRPGRFERASGGTLFLDEIASLSMVAQGKLLRAVQEGEIERVGGTRPIKVDVRVVAATNVDLRDEVQAGRFREDLFFRLNVFPIELPPLRERRDDIPLLMEHFLALFAARHGRRVKGFTRRAIEAMFNYDYPGNIRELQNLIERGVIFADDDSFIDTVHMFRQGELIGGDMFAVGIGGPLQQSGAKSAALPRRAAMADVPLAPAGGHGADARRLARTALDGGATLAELEGHLYSEALARAGGNIAAAARLLGLTRAQLDYRLAKERAGSTQCR